MAQCCDSCRFWVEDKLQHKDGEELVGECRRFPPTCVLTDRAESEWEEERAESIRANEWIPRAAHSYVYWSFPFLLETEWCGEYKPR